MNNATRAFRESLEELAHETGLDEAMGFFPPESELRRIGAEMLPFLASGRALLLQVAHPTVGQGVHDHSNFRTDALGRGFRTFGALYIMGYGRQQLAIDVAVKVYKIHQKIKGAFPEDQGEFAGKKYSAMERDANVWVLATLLEGTKFAYDEVDPGAMQGERLEHLYRDFKMLGRFFNVKDNDLPPTYAEFQRYFDETVAHKLKVTPSAQKVAKALQGTLKLPYAPGNWMLHVLAAETLPENIRIQFGIKRSAATRAAYQSARAAMRAVHNNLPPQLNKLPLGLIPAGRVRVASLFRRPGSRRRQASIR
jgi:uncharacterized protein (DUF2236 family)